MPAARKIGSQAANDIPIIYRTWTLLGFAFKEYVSPERRY